MGRSKPLEIHANPQERFVDALKAVVGLPREKVKEYQEQHKPFRKVKPAKNKT